MPILFRSSSKIVSNLSNCEVKFYFYNELLLNLNHHLIFFRSIVTMNDLRIQYPNKELRHLIYALPSYSTSIKYFKPEAHLLIEKFLSLKKESSRALFIGNMMQHTRARHKVSSILLFIFQRGTLQASTIFISF
jgi:hypothetical protein